MKDKYNFSLEQIVRFLSDVYSLYHKLILLVGPSGSGKTALLKLLSQKLSLPIINLSLELSKSLLTKPREQIVLDLPQLLDEICCRIHEDVILLDNTELLFEPILKSDPLELLKKLSRKRTVIATWNGEIENNYLTYAFPGHPSFRRYRLTPGDLMWIDLKEEKHEIQRPDSI